MLNENIKTLRRKKGLTQEELAIRLNVVRQTVSKWEKGLSVPDADMLQKIADILEVSVTSLLGTPNESQPENDALVEQLARLNEQLAVRNRRSRRVWKVIGILLAAFILFHLLLVFFSFSTSMEITSPAVSESQVLLSGSFSSGT